MAKNQHQLSSSAKILVKIKIAIFKIMGDRPACIDKVFRVIQSLSLTSVEAESFFSSWSFYYKNLSTYQLTNFVFFLRKFFLNAKNYVLSYFLTCFNYKHYCTEYYRPTEGWANIAFNRDADSALLSASKNRG